MNILKTTFAAAVLVGLTACGGGDSTGTSSDTVSVSGKATAPVTVTVTGTANATVDTNGVITVTGPITTSAPTTVTGVVSTPVTITAPSGNTVTGTPTAPVSVTGTVSGPVSITGSAIVTSANGNAVSGTATVTGSINGANSVGTVTVTPTSTTSPVSSATAVTVTVTGTTTSPVTVTGAIDGTTTVVPTTSAPSSAVNPAPVKPSMLTVAYKMVEEFAEITSPNAALSATMFAQVTPKASYSGELKWLAYTGTPNYNASQTAITGQYAVDFGLKNVFCENYKLVVTYKETQNWGNRYFDIKRIEDGKIIQAQLLSAGASTATTVTYDLTRLANSAPESIRITSRNTTLMGVEVNATCQKLDSDSDGLIDEVEALLGTDPRKPDTDGDGISDGAEAANGLNPLNSADGGNADMDQDGITNAQAIARGISLAPQKPVALNVEISAPPRNGTPLLATYEYQHAHFVPEGSSTIEWTVGTTVYKQNSYTPAKSDIGKDISVCVTPAMKFGLPGKGDKVCSDAYPILPTVADWTGLGPVTLAGRHDGVGVDLVIVGDGFTAAEADKFKQTALNFVNNFNTNFDAPKVHRTAWNIHAVGVASVDSGVTDCTATPAITLNTYFNSKAGCGGVARIVVSDGGIVTTTAHATFPQADKYVVLVNSTRYGGVASGNMAVSTASPTSVGVIFHELGHAFGQLADEYLPDSAPMASEPWQKNLSNIGDPSTVKWKHWIPFTAALPATDKGKVGVFGAALFRPTVSSIMMGGNNNFYSVNTESWALEVYRKSPPTFNPLPSQLDRYTHDKAVRPTFSLDSVYESTKQEFIWYVDNLEVARGSMRSLQIPVLKAGNYVVKAVIADKSGAILRDDEALSSQTVVWNVTAQ